MGIDVRLLLLLCPFGVLLFYSFREFIIETVIQSLIEFAVVLWVDFGNTLMEDEIASEIDGDESTCEDTTIFGSYF